MNYQNSEKNWRLKAFMKGLSVGVFVMTVAWILVIERTKEIHKQELDYIIKVNNENLRDTINVN